MTKILFNFFKYTRFDSKWEKKCLGSVDDKLKELGADCDRLKALQFGTCCLESVTIVCDKLEKVHALHDRLKAQILEDLSKEPSGKFLNRYSLVLLHYQNYYQIMTCLISEMIEFIEMCSQKLISFIIKEGEHLCVGARRVVDAIVVSAVILLSFVYLYLIGFIDGGGSKAGSSGSLDFRDIYISIDLFQAAYIWIKFRDVIPRGAVYYRHTSNKFEPRIYFLVSSRMGKSKRIPLRSYDTRAEAEIVFQIAAFYCDKPMYCLGRLHLGGGAYFRIPTFNVDPNLAYEEKVKQVRVQVLKVYAMFEFEKTSRNQPPSVPGLALEMPTGEGELLTTSPIQQPQEPLNSGMELAMQGQGSQPASNIHNGVDFNNPSSAVLAKTQHELLEALKEIDSLKAQLSREQDERNELKQRYSELEGLLGQSRLPELDFDPETFFDEIEA